MRSRLATEARQALAADMQRMAPGWGIDEKAYWSVLPAISVWAHCGLFIATRAQGGAIGNR